MMGKYLDEDKKIFYIEAFMHVASCQGDSNGKIENDLYPILKVINESKHYRTMYSQSRYPEREDGRIMDSSYLKLCYTYEAKLILTNDVIPLFEGSFNQDDNGQLRVSWNSPYTQKEVDLSTKSDCLKYTLHPDYYNIMHVKIHLKGGGVEDHNTFWDLVKLKFK